MGYHQGEEETVYDKVLGDSETERNQEDLVQANAHKVGSWKSIRQIS